MTRDCPLPGNRIPSRRMKVFPFGRWLASLSLLLAACTVTPPPASPLPRPAGASVATSAARPAETARAVRIATFNIQNFGVQKMSKAAVVSTLVQIVRRYDIVAVQELSDVNNTVAGAFLARLNAEPGPRYGMVLSQRSGREPDDRTSAEQYAFYFNTERVFAQDQGELYPDGARDEFQREPFAAGFVTQGSGIKFVLLTIHTRPESSRQEIPALAHALAWARTRFPGQEGFVLLGDFNASGSYASPRDLAGWRTRELPHLWIVPDTADSNVSPATARAYDRIIATDAMAERFGGRWGVDQAFTDAQVSDHWPVWAEFGADARR